MSQPFLNAQSIVLQAPIQCWSRPDGQVVAPDAPHTTIAQGIFCGDDRTVSRLVLSASGRDLEHIATTECGGAQARYDYVVRTPELGVDPQVVVERTRRVSGDCFAEDFAVRSASTRPVALELVVELTPDATAMTEIKSGLPGTALAPVPSSGTTISWAWRETETRIELEAPDAEVTVVGDHYRIAWRVDVPARGLARVGFRIVLSDTGAPFVATTAAPLVGPDVDGAPDSLRRLVDASFRDLNGLRLAERAGTEEAFLAAGAPWFFTLFGRDSLIAARLLLPTNLDLAASTLAVLAARQGHEVDADNAEQPGKILHEIRRVALDLHDTHQITDDEHPSHDFVLPAEYYGTIDATPLWILLFADAVAAGLDEHRARALVPALERALGWLRDFADADGDGFLEYFDESGHGLANQGWKDSGDSIRWANGEQAEGPIALVEVQGYAHAAALAGADLLDRFGGTEAADEAADWRAWAARLADRFRAQFWVSDDLGRYPALALDRHKRPVDGVSSNIGHLLGTGILDADESRAVVDRLMSSTMCSGYGIRTLSTTNVGYWPLGYHVGSVWTHDTAVIIDGMLRDGFTDEATELAAQLLRAAEGFDYRMPELFAGTPASEAYPPVPYPAACRPQAWAAASTVTIVRALKPEVLPAT